MAVLNIKDAEVYRLASEIATATGKSLTRVVRDALRTEHTRIVCRKRDTDRIASILAEMDALPVLDNRPIGEILGDLYDDNGLPK
jgi:antitoxin VapB